jgi:glutamyl-tRNA reductase
VVAGLRGLPAPPEIVVVARTPEKVTIDGGEVWPFIRAAEALATFPAVVSATSAKRRLVPDEDLAGLLGERSAPLTLVDMAMPPDFTPPAGSQIRYVDIDMLARMADRRPRRGDADAMVAAAAADAYRRVTYHQALGPVMEGLVRSADTIVDRAVDRFGGRLADEEDRAVLRQTAHTVARTLLAGPIAYLQSTDRPAEAVDAIAEAFGLQDDG